MVISIKGSQPKVCTMERYGTWVLQREDFGVCSSHKEFKDRRLKSASLAIENRTYTDQRGEGPLADWLVRSSCWALAPPASSHGVFQAWHRILHIPFWALLVKRQGPGSFVMCHSWKSSFKVSLRGFWNTFYRIQPKNLAESVQPLISNLISKESIVSI